MHACFAGRVLPDNIRYIPWPEGGACHPKVLDAGDFERIRTSSAHFCRKLDSHASAAVLLRLLAWREAEPRRPSRVGRAA